MATRRVKFTFPPQLITEPIIYQMGMEFHVVTNIRRADVRRSGDRAHRDYIAVDGYR